MAATVAAARVVAARAVVAEALAPLAGLRVREGVARVREGVAKVRVVAARVRVAAARARVAAARAKVAAARVVGTPMPAAVDGLTERRLAGCQSPVLTKRGGMIQAGGHATSH